MQDNYNHTAHDNRRHLAGRVAHAAGHHAGFWGSLSPAERKGYRVALLLAFAVGLLAELLLFTRAQMLQIGGLLKDDFRIVVVKGERGRERAADIESALRGLKGAADVAFVDKESRLKRLRDEDPELVSSVLSVGGNPLPDTWEIMPEDWVIGGIEQWAESVWKVPGVVDVKYKPLEAYAIMHAMFYARLIDLGFYAVALVYVLFFAMVLTYRKTWQSLTAALRKDAAWFAAGAGGAALAALAAYGLVYPLKYLSPLWAWPGLWLHVLLCAASGAGAWVLCQWKNER